MQVGFDELYLTEVETSRRVSTQPKRGAGEIRPNHNPMGTCQVQAHLTGAAPNLYDARIARNRSVDQSREFTALGARSQPTQAGTWRIVRKRYLFIKVADNFRSPLARQS
jgi:hypothetical protein